MSHGKNRSYPVFSWLSRMGQTLFRACPYQGAVKDRA